MVDSIYLRGAVLTDAERLAFELGDQTAFTSKPVLLVAASSHATPSPNGPPGIVSTLLTVDQVASISAAVALSTDASKAVLAVTVSDLAASKTYSAIIGARVALNTIGTPANAGYIDIVTVCTIATNASAVATVTLPVLVVPDTSKLPSEIATATATVSATTGGFTLYATRVASTSMRVTLGQVWIRDIVEVS